MVTICQTGDTIRVTGIFSTFAGVVADLAAAPTVTLYDFAMTAVGTPGTGTKSATGTYYYDITLPTVAGWYYLEFKGTSESKPIVRRISLSVTFANDVT